MGGGVTMNTSSLISLGDMFIQFGNYLKQTESKIINVSPIDEKKYLTTKEVVEIYSPALTAYSIREAIYRDNFPCVKRGKRYFFLQEDIDKWLAKKKVTNNDNEHIKYV